MSLFRSLKERPLLQKFQDLLWPKIGLRRWGRYVFLRIMRLQASPYQIAMGVALGAAISFTPFLGFHIILALALSWIFRANKISALLGTLVGTPWTLPFMFFLSYKTGLLMAEFFHYWFPQIPLSSDFLGTTAFNFKDLYNHPAAFFFPMLTGSFLLGIGFGGCVFLLTFMGIKVYRNHQRKTP